MDADYAEIKPLIEAHLEAHQACGIVSVRDGGDRRAHVARFKSETNPQVEAGMEVRRHWLTGTSELQNRLAGLANEMRLPLLDLTPMLREASRKGLNVIYTVDGHWNPLGHRLAAGAISEWLTSEHVFELPVALASE